MHKLSDASTTISTVLSSFDGEDGIETESILRLMEYEHFSKLRQCFFGPNAKAVGEKTVKSKDCPSTGSQLSRTEFVVAVEKILGWSGSGIGAAKVFDEVDTECKGFISWEIFLDHTIAEIGAADIQRRPTNIFSSKATTYHPISQLKRLIENFGFGQTFGLFLAEAEAEGAAEGAFFGRRWPKPNVRSDSTLQKADTISKIITMKMTESPPSNATVYAVVSSGGFVAYCDENFGPFQTDSSYRVPLSGTEETIESLSGIAAAAVPFASPIGQPRSKISRAWITDAILMEDINVIVFATSDRCLHFRDVEGRGFPWLFHVTGLRHVPTCLAYWHSDKVVAEEKSSGSRRLTKEEEESRLDDKTKTTTADKIQEKSSAPCDKGHSVLLFGDDGGNIWSLKFLLPADGLFHRSRRKGEAAEQIHWLELDKKTKEAFSPDAIESDDKKRRSKNKSKSKLAKLIRETDNPHEKFVEITVERKVHSDAVSRLSYRLGAPQAVVSCSNGDRCRRRVSEKKIPSSERDGDFNGGIYSSLRLQTLSSQALPYVFQIPSGISCFDLWELEEDVCSDYENFFLATGSSDGLIRLWNPYVTKLAVATLAGHEHKIVDLVFLMKKRQLLLISLCIGAEVRVWKTGLGRNPDNASCLQVISLNFPGLGPHGRKPEFGSKALYAAIQGQRMKILVSCCTEVASLCFIATQSFRGVSTNEEEEEEGEDTEDNVQQRRTEESLLLEVEAETAAMVKRDEEGEQWMKGRGGTSVKEDGKEQQIAEGHDRSLNNDNSHINGREEVTKTGEEDNGKRDEGLGPSNRKSVQREVDGIFVSVNLREQTHLDSDWLKFLHLRQCERYITTDAFPVSRRDRIFQSALRTSFSSSPANSGGRGPHAMQSLQQIHRKKMRKFVSSLGAPHLALPLHPPVQVNVQPSLDKSRLHSFLSQI